MAAYRILVVLLYMQQCSSLMTCEKDAHLASLLLLCTLRISLSWATTGKQPTTPLLTCTIA